MKHEDTIHWCLYWLGIGFIVGCLAVAFQAGADPGNPIDCVGAPPACEYGRVAVCWCYEDECHWYCAPDGKAASCS